jgi:hypothetical protein
MDVIALQPDSSPSSGSESPLSTGDLNETGMYIVAFKFYLLLKILDDVIRI